MFLSKGRSFISLEVEVILVFEEVKNGSDGNTVLVNDSKEIKEADGC